MNAQSVEVGSVPPHGGTPELFVIVRDGDNILLKIDAYRDSAPEAFVFTESLVWGRWVSLGFGHCMHLVNLDDHRKVTLWLDLYFGHLYVGPDYLLVASASCLTRLEPDGSVLWTSDEVGVDGVTVTSAAADLISGDGEWDPPGDWRPFTIDARTGKRLERP